MFKKACQRCGSEYTAGSKSHNSLYCSKLCKNRTKAEREREEKPEMVKARRRRSYEQTKAHPDRYAAHVQGSNANKKEVRQWLSNYKSLHGCSECGYNVHPAALQLHHTGKKTAEIAMLRSSATRLMDEIVKGKCIVLCANCHAIETWKQKQNVRDNDV